MQTLYALLSSLLIALLVQHFASRVRIESAPSRMLAAYNATEAEPTLLERIGDRLLRFIPINPAKWQADAAWARLLGLRASLGGTIGRSAMFGLAAAFSLAVLAPPIWVWLALPVAAALPFIQLRGRANDSRNAVRRALPETAALIAAEFAANNPAGKALERAAATPGPLGLIITGAVSEARTSNRPLFSRKPMKGALTSHFERWGLPPLLAFGKSLDLVSDKGVAGESVMARIAQNISREYREQLLRQAENLESALLLPTALYFFLPFMAAIILPILLPLFETLGG